MEKLRAYIEDACKRIDRLDLVEVIIAHEPDSENHVDELIKRLIGMD